MKEFLSQKGVKFTEKDIRKDDKALEEVIHLGAMSTPVTVIDGQPVFGYDVKKLEELLKEE